MRAYEYVGDFNINSPSERRSRRLDHPPLAGLALAPPTRPRTRSLAYRRRVSPGSPTANGYVAELIAIISSSNATHWSLISTSRRSRARPDASRCMLSDSRQMLLWMERLNVRRISLFQRGFGQQWSIVWWALLVVNQCDRPSKSSQCVDRLVMRQLRGFSRVGCVPAPGRHRPRLAGRCDAFGILLCTTQYLSSPTSKKSGAIALRMPCYCRWSGPLLIRIRPPRSQLAGSRSFHTRCRRSGIKASGVCSHGMPAGKAFRDAVTRHSPSHI